MSKNLRFPKLFITDLDDTALGGGFKPYSRFPDVFSKFLDKLVLKECQWATNTTWEIYSQMQMIFASAVTSRPAYLVGGKGLQLCSMRGDEMISIQPYTEQMNHRLEEVSKDYHRPFIREICSKYELEKINYNGFWFTAVASDNDAKALLSYIEERAEAFDMLDFITFPDKSQISVFPAFLKKSHALKEIIRITGLRPEDIVVAGDGLIDLDMMTDELAGYVICPNNAHPEVKELVTKRKGVIGTENCGPGVIEAFEILARGNGWEWE